MTTAQRRTSTLNCPLCRRAFIIGPDFVPNVVATGRTWASGRAEVRCGICGYTWWSKESGALRKARAVARLARSNVAPTGTIHLRRNSRFSANAPTRARKREPNARKAVS